jgi:hypothetical protein
MTTLNIFNFNFFENALFGANYAPNYEAGSAYGLLFDLHTAIHNFQGSNITI